MSDRYDSWIKGMVQRRECENGNTIVIWNDVYELHDRRR